METSTRGENTASRREGVEASARAAGLLNTRGPTQLLQFSAAVNSSDIRLLELPDKVLEAITTRGEKVVIKGEPNDDAVLCTDDMTFELRTAETSNALLVVPHLLCPNDPGFVQTPGESDGLMHQEVTACLSNYLELRRCQPRTEKLKNLLSECPYRGEEYEPSGATDDHQGSKFTLMHKKYTFEDLLDCVQASERELEEALEKLQACLINGCWRVLDMDYRERVFQQVLTLLEEEDWSHTCVPLEPCCHRMASLEPRLIVEHCLRCYGTEAVHPSTGEVSFELMEEKVCQFYAELLLRSVDKFDYHDFMQTWQQAVPEGMTTDTKYLKGLALRDVTGSSPAIWYFPVSALPHNPQSRFENLFSVREKWTHSDIEPYVRDLETPSQSLNAILLRYTRSSSDGRGERTYTSKII